MSRHETFGGKTRAELNAVPVASPDVPEHEHFYVCPECEQRVDMRRLGDVLHHDEAGHAPLPAEPEAWTPCFIKTMQPLLVDSPPEGDDWLHEIKYDGYRTQIQIRDGDGRAFTRNGHDWSHLYGLVLARAGELPCDSAIIDGEIVVQHPDGRCDFHGLRRAIQKEPDALMFMAFDLLELDGRDLRKQPLERRRDLLAKLIGPSDPASPLQFSEHLVGSGQAVFAAADGMGLEGIVSKRAGSRYSSGSSDKWLKTKTYVEEELTVIGTERSIGPTVALLARDTGGALEYAGGAMVTLTHRERDRLWEALEPLRRDRPVLPIKARKDALWVEPVVKVRVRTLRSEEKLRHATVTGIAHVPERQVGDRHA